MTAAKVEFKNRIHGYGQMKSDKESYFGGFQEGLKHGPGLVVWPDGNLKLGYWNNGKLLYGFQHWIKDNNVTIQDWKEKPRQFKPFTNTSILQLPSCIAKQHKTRRS
jgi:hypothetical protein